jgi:hypothetical protein
MCYRFELLEFEDATYILHLEGNGRLDHIHEQLKKFIRCSNSVKRSDGTKVKP